jgi:hypothetical protein
MLFARGLAHDTGKYYVIRFPVNSDGIGAGQLLTEHAQLLRSYIAAEPLGKEALTAAYYQPEGAGVMDMIHRAMPDLPGGLPAAGVPYEVAPGFPEKPVDQQLYDLSPFYTWDGSRVIAPLRWGGLSINEIGQTSSGFVKYPEMGQRPDLVSSGPLPDQGEDMYAWFAFGFMKPEGYQSRVFRLALTGAEWTELFRVPFPVYSVASDNPLTGRWVLVGSTTNFDLSAYAMPGIDPTPELGPFTILSLGDPQSGSVSPLVLEAEPSSRIALEPRGLSAVFMDASRSALLHIDLGTGATRRDDDLYLEESDVRVMVGTAAEKVVVWRGPMLRMPEFRDGEEMSIAPMAEFSWNLRPDASGTAPDETAHAAD